MNKSVKMLSETCSAHLPGWLEKLPGFISFTFYFNSTKSLRPFGGKKLPDELKIQGQISRGNKRKKKNSTRPRAMLYSSSVTKLL